uniref:Leucine-rich repeat-containing N-terminal plant-type domain-containing protein n=1 Tax=Oryza glumipatula TaxID=40148 RepID=A0A0E0BK85_9ORYZ
MVRCLRFRDCEMRSLEGNMNCLSSLNKLDIHFCPNISSLPDLPSSLQHLSIWGYLSPSSSLVSALRCLLQLTRYLKLIWQFSSLLWPVLSALLGSLLSPIAA